MRKKGKKEKEKFFYLTGGMKCPSSVNSRIVHVPVLVSDYQFLE